MRKKLFCTILPVVLTFGFALASLAEMGSENYRIPTSVTSGGGAPMDSATYKTDSTLGQSSPLIDPNTPPYSESYDNYSGFWYTLEAAMDCSDLACFAAAFGSISPHTNYNGLCDFDKDGDVDGSDLAEFAGNL